MSPRMGVDLGGTKVEAVVLGPDDEELVRRRVPTPTDDYQAVVDAIADLVEVMFARFPDSHQTIGVGTPGAISPFDGLMKNSNSTALNGRPLDRDLAERMGRPIVMRNDADCFALSEARAMAIGGTIFGVIIGTGVGGGIVVDGRLVDGPNSIAGEWGHNPLPWPTDEERGMARDCYCGKVGCIETWLSGPGFAATHAAFSGVQAEAPEIVARARGGDASAAASLEAYVDRLARGLASVINVLDPSVVVLGGGMSNVLELYEQLPPRLDSHVFGGEAATRVVRNTHGDSSGVRGAAMLVEP